tara:strand:- start:9776 stop:10264 length:489 start_codon:yes stop_codon:yes gene_type:complete
MKYLKTYHQINESRRVTAARLLTRHRETVMDFIEGLNELVADRVEFCQDPVGSSRAVTAALDSLVTNIATDSGLEEMATVAELARLFQGGLVKSIAAIAQPKMQEFAGGGPLKMSEEVLTSIADHMIQKYGQSGEQIMSAITGLLQELQVNVEPFCEDKNLE